MALGIFEGGITEQNHISLPAVPLTGEPGSPSLILQQLWPPQEVQNPSPNTGHPLGHCLWSVQLCGAFGISVKDRSHPLLRVKTHPAPELATATACMGYCVGPREGFGVLPALPTPCQQTGEPQGRFPEDLECPASLQDAPQ